MDTRTRFTFDDRWEVQTREFERLVVHVYEKLRGTIFGFVTAMGLRASSADAVTSDFQEKTG